MNKTARFILAYEGLRKSRLYKVLLPCAFVTFWCLGSIFSVSVLSLPIQKHNPHWDDEIVPRALSVQGAVAGIVPIFVGRDLNRRGHDFYATVGVVIQALGGLLAAISLFLDQAWQYYIASLLQGIGYGCLYTTLVHYILMWFQDMPGATSGIIGGALGFGSMSFTGIYYRSARNLGPQWTFIILPIVVALASLPITMTLSTPPNDFIRLIARRNAPARSLNKEWFKRNATDQVKRLSQLDVDLEMVSLPKLAPPKLDEPATHVIDLPEGDEAAVEGKHGAVAGSEYPQNIMYEDDLEAEGMSGLDVAQADTILDDGFAPDMSLEPDTSIQEQKQTWKQKLSAKLSRLRGKSKVGYAKLKGDSGSGGNIDVGSVIDTTNDDVTSPPAASASSIADSSMARKQVGPDVEVEYEPLTRSELAARREMWLMGTIIMTSLTPGWGLLSCYSMMFTSLLRYSEAAAASTIATITFVYALGRLLWGLVSDKLGFVNSYSLFLVGQSLIYLVAPFVVRNYAGLFIFMLCLNASFYGGAKVVIGPLANWIFHRENAAAATGLSMVAIALASALGPNVAALCVESGKRGAAAAAPGEDPMDSMHRGFSSFFFFCSIITTVGSLACLILKPIPDKVRKVASQKTETR